MSGTPRTFLKRALTCLSGFAFACIALSGRAADAEGDQFLVRDGKPVAQIVIAKNPARMTRLAAAELQANIEKISGAKLPIVTEPVKGQPAVYVGISEYTKALGLETKDLKQGAFRMASGPGWFALLGADHDFTPVEPYIHGENTAEKERVLREWDAITGDTFAPPLTVLFGDYHPELDVWEHDDKGTINAVYSFLGSLGARWYFPGRLGEILPKLSTIPIPQVDKVVRADFPVRQFRYFHWRNSATKDEILWNLRMGGESGWDTLGMVQPAHGLKFVLLRDEIKKAHPEYFALRNGERATVTQKRTGSPCLTSQGLLEKHVKFVRNVFDHYSEPMISIDIPDGHGEICEDKLCQAWSTPGQNFKGRLSDYVWQYVNRVAQEVYRTHPDKMVSGLIYGGYQLPPEKIDQMSPNLAIVEARRRSGFSNPETRDYYAKLREAWLKKLPSKQWVIWDYYIDGRPDGPLAGVPQYFPRQIAEDLHSLKGISLGDTIEVYRHPHHLADRKFTWNDMAISHLNIYVTSRYWWDADQDINKLLDEYYTLFYGPAREQMKTFIEYCSANWKKMPRDLKAIDHSIELLHKAQAAVEPGSIYAERIALASDYMEQMKPLREKLAKGKEGLDVAIPVIAKGSPGLQLDGSASEAFWKDVPEIAFRDVVSGADPLNKTKVRMAWGENDMLYVHVRCEDADMAGVRDTSTQDDDAAVWTGDFLEFLIETPAYSYYQIAVSPSGHLLDINRRGGINTLWSSGAKVATQRGDGYWQVEMQIPAGGETAEEVNPDLGIAGDKPTKEVPWYINISRQRIRGKVAELSALSPTGKPKFHDPFKFGRLTVQDD